MACLHLYFILFECIVYSSSERARESCQFIYNFSDFFIRFAVFLMLTSSVCPLNLFLSSARGVTFFLLFLRRQKMYLADVFSWMQCCIQCICQYHNSLSLKGHGISFTIPNNKWRHRGTYSFISMLRTGV